LHGDEKGPKKGSKKSQNIISQVIWQAELKGFRMQPFHVLFANYRKHGGPLAAPRTNQPG
jgi:hypothetical protein